MLLFGDLAEGGDVLIDVRDDGLVLVPTPTTRQLEHLSEPPGKLVSDTNLDNDS